MPQAQQPKFSSMAFVPVSHPVPHDSSMAHQHQHQQQVTHQYMPYQPRPHQQRYHHQQQRMPQCQHRQQLQPRMPHQESKQSIKQSLQAPQYQSPQLPPRFPQAHPQTQTPPQIRLQLQATQSESGRSFTPQQQEPQPPLQAAQSRPASPMRKNISVIDIQGPREGDSKMPGLGSLNLQNPSVQPAQPMGETMPPPPRGGSYPTLDSLRKAVLRYCTSVGYAVVIGRSQKTASGLKKVLFICDRAGKPLSRVSPEHKQRKTSSRKCDCPFGFFAIEQWNQWAIVYRPDNQNRQHNHGPSENPSYHPAARKLNSQMIATVKHLKENGVGVPETLQILQNENPLCHLLPRDIYNARASINRNHTQFPKPQSAPSVPEKSPIKHTKQPQKIRSELRSQLWKARDDLKKIEEEKRAEIDSLKDTIKEKDKVIAQFEMFIDICNQGGMSKTKRLFRPGEYGIASTAARNQ